MGILRRKKGETPKAATNEVSDLSVTTKEPTMKSLAKTCAEYTIFKFDDKDVRIVAKDGEPWFLASDLCDVLGLDATSIRKLDADEKGLYSMQTLGGSQQMAIVSESGMWTLILRCRDAVKHGTVPYRVRKWVTAEVLPSIRKTGSYEKTTKAKKSLHGKITPDQQDAIKQLVMSRGKALPKDKQAKAMITMWSALKSHFGVTYKEIMEDQFAEALSLAARVEISGEYIAKQEQFTDIDINMLLHNATAICHHVGRIKGVWQAELEPALRVLQSPLAAELHDRIAAIYSFSNGIKHEIVKMQSNITMRLN